MFTVRASTRRLDTGNMVSYGTSIPAAPDVVLLDNMGTVMTVVCIRRFVLNV